MVIVGTGQGGFQVAASLREEGFDGRVLLVGDEPDLPYQRPPLSKAYLTGEADADLVRMRPETFFAEHGVELRAGEQVTRIDRAERQVVLASGKALPYDHLVLALGARNRPLPVPGADLDGVVQLRTLGEAEALRQRLDAAREAVVVGAGFIGLEFAAAASRGIPVTVIEATDRPMARAVSPAMSHFFRGAHERQGVRFAFGATVVRVLGTDGRASGVETADGRRFAADLVLVGIGVIPNAELAADAGLAVANGIVVDEHLQTSDPAISAIGDCAAHPSRFAPGAPVRIESVQNAVDHARCVAARLAGRPAPYASLPWFWSEQGKLKLQIAGLATPHERAVVRGDPAQEGKQDGKGGGFSVFCYSGGKLVGVESVNRPLDHVLARKLLTSGVTVTPEQAADRGFDLRSAGARPEKIR
ncbi:MAG: FAD-dependent oxidoreductase [Acetobacteraceae bacterium]|nr:FAD-dependent oxidoreductase [Acetobacteraceae bacterium]